jgi:hypothetical protein
MKYIRLKFWSNSWSNEVKYLGVIQNRKLACRSHINKAVSKANRRPRQLFSVKNNSSFISINLPLTFFKTVLRPVITYGVLAWEYAAKSHLSRLEAFQSKLLRITTKLPRVTSIEIFHDQTGMEAIKSRVS